MDEALVAECGGDRSKAFASLVDDVIDAIFKRTDENRLLSVRLRSGQNKVLYRSELVSGAILASIVQRAKEKAIDRTIQSDKPAGLVAQDLLDSVAEEFREGEMLPPDDAAEEWLKLLDHHPEQVIGISSFRRGRQTEERLINQII
jgi:proteasome-associated ATPase